MVTPLRERWVVKVEDGRELHVQGNIVDHEYAIEDGGSPSPLCPRSGSASRTPTGWRSRRARTRCSCSPSPPSSTRWPTSHADRQILSDRCFLPDCLRPRRPEAGRRARGQAGTHIGCPRVERVGGGPPSIRPRRPVPFGGWRASPIGPGVGDRRGCRSLGQGVRVRARVRGRSGATSSCGARKSRMACRSPSGARVRASGMTVGSTSTTASRAGSIGSESATTTRASRVSSRKPNSRAWTTARISMGPSPVGARTPRRTRTVRDAGARRTAGSYRATAVTPASGHAAYPRRSR